MPDVPASRPRPPHPPRVAPEDLGFLFADVVRELPEFVPRYAGLVEAGDDDPGEPAVLTELAEFVSDRLAAVEAAGSALSRALGLVEALLAGRAEDRIGTELVGYAFFDALTLEDRRQLVPRVGPRSRDLIEWLEDPLGEDQEW